MIAEPLPLVSGNHLLPNTNVNVIGLWIDGQSIDFVPLEMTNHLPNLRVFQMYYNSLRTLASSDLRQFGNNLQVVSFPGNQLVEIDYRLFDYTPNVRHISFNANRIRNVGLDAFKSLTSLTTLNFENLCLSKSASTFASVNDLKHEIAANCPPTITMLENQLFGSERFKAQVGVAVSSYVNSLEQKINELERRNTNLEAKVNAYTEEIANLIKIVDEHSVNITWLHGAMDLLLIPIETTSLTP